MFRLVASDLAKRFGHRRVFSRIDIDLVTGKSLAVVGRNGSGKSTLLKILLSLHHPDQGTVKYFRGAENLSRQQVLPLVSFVAPYLNLYDYLSAEENLRFFATMAGINLTGKGVDEVLERVGLQGRGADHVAGYSSGMKQRLKYALALVKKPAFLFLDEPSANLDADGKVVVEEIIEQSRSDCIIVVATNEPEEYCFAREQCRLDQ